MNYNSDESEFDIKRQKLIDMSRIANLWLDNDITNRCFRLRLNLYSKLIVHLISYPGHISAAWIIGKKTCDGLFIEEAGIRIDSNAMGFLFLVRGENQDSRGKTSQTRACLSKVPTTFRAQKSQLSNFNLLVLKSWCLKMLKNVRKTKRTAKVDGLEPWQCEEIKGINCGTRKVSWILRNRPQSREPLSSTHRTSRPESNPCYIGRRGAFSPLNQRF